MAGHLLVWRLVVAIELGIELNQTDRARVGDCVRTDSPAGFASLFDIHGQYNLDHLSHKELEVESTDTLLDLPNPSIIDLPGPFDTSTEAESDPKSPPLDMGIARNNRSSMTAVEPESELTLAPVAPIIEDAGSERAIPVSAHAHEQVTSNAVSRIAVQEQVTGNAAIAGEAQVTGNLTSASGDEEQVTEISGPEAFAFGPEFSTPAISSPKGKQATEYVLLGPATPRTANPVQELVTEEVGSEPAIAARARAIEESANAIGVVKFDRRDPSGAQQVDYSGVGSEQHMVSKVEPEPGVVGFDNAGPFDTHTDEVIIPPILEKVPSQDDLEVNSSGTDLHGPSDLSTEAQLDFGSARTNPRELSADEPEVKLILPSVEPRTEVVEHANYADLAGFRSGELRIIAVVEPVVEDVAFNIAGPSHTIDEEEILPPGGNLPSEDIRSHEVRSSCTQLSGPYSVIGHEDLTRLTISEPRDTTPDVRTLSGRFSNRYSFVPSSIELAGLLVSLPGLELDEGISELELVEEIADTEPADPADLVASEHGGPSNTPAQEHVFLASVDLALKIIGPNPASSATTSAEVEPGSDSGYLSLGESFHTAVASSLSSEHLSPSEVKSKNFAVDDAVDDAVEALDDAGPSGTKYEDEIVEEALDDAGPSGTKYEDEIVEEALDDAGPSGTKYEDEIVEDLPSGQVHPNSPDLAGPSSPKGKSKLPPLRILESREISDDISSDGTPHCRNFCGSDDEDKGNRSPVDDLVELGCNCRGNMGLMCVKCLIKWFSPRILVQKKLECEICKAPLPEKLRELMLSKYADPTGGGLELIEALGKILEREHNRRVRRMNAGTNHNFAWLHSITQGLQARTPALPAPGPPAPEPLPVSTAPDVTLPPLGPRPPHPMRSFWRKLAKFMKCGAPQQ